MNPVLYGSGEISLLVENSRYIPLDELGPWEQDAITVQPKKNFVADMSQIEEIIPQWLSTLTPKQISKIKRLHSLNGIPLPRAWIQVWRQILKDPQLRDAETATHNGQDVGTDQHLWNLWAEECIEKYLDYQDKCLLYLKDKGYSYTEIGVMMMDKFGDSFWKPRKKNSTTTPSQIVNNYFYQTLPTKIVRRELLDIILHRR